MNRVSQLPFGFLCLVSALLIVSVKECREDTAQARKTVAYMEKHADDSVRIAHLAAEGAGLKQQLAGEKETVALATVQLDQLRRKLQVATPRALDSAAEKVGVQVTHRDEAQVCVDTASFRDAVTCLATATLGDSVKEGAARALAHCEGALALADSAGRILADDGAGCRAALQDAGDARSELNFKRKRKWVWAAVNLLVGLVTGTLLN